MCEISARVTNILPIIFAFEVSKDLGETNLKYLVVFVGFSKLVANFPDIFSFCFRLKCVENTFRIFI